MNKKRFVACVLSCLMVLSVLTGCKSNDAAPVGSEMVTVRDIKGEVDIPLHPKRIVDLSGNSDILHLLGLPVVGTANSDAYDYTRLPVYLEDALKDAEIVGFSYQDTMDIEVIMNLNPDLIIISTVQDKMYDQLSRMAPTVMIQLEALNWKEDIRTIAKLFQKDGVAEEWLKAYEKTSQSVGQALKETYGEEASYLSLLASGGQFFIFDGAGFGTVLYDDLYLERPIGMPEQTDVSLPVMTYEGLASIEATYMFVLGTQADFEALDAHPVWNALPAVQEGNVIFLPASPYFTQGYSAIGRLELIKGLEDLMNEK